MVTVTSAPHATPAHLAQTIDGLVTRTTKWDLPHSTPGTTATLRPGAPDASALLVRMRSRRPSSQMPPLGSHVADLDAVNLMAAFIADLGRGEGSRDAR